MNIAIPQALVSQIHAKSFTELVEMVGGTEGVIYEKDLPEGRIAGYAVMRCSAPKEITGREDVAILHRQGF